MALNNESISARAYEKLQDGLFEKLLDREIASGYHVLVPLLFNNPLVEMVRTHERELFTSIRPPRHELQNRKDAARLGADHGLARHWFRLHDSGRVEGGLL